MILRHLAEAIKKQSWFTALLELMIVVLGIYIGLQVDDWNDIRKERQLETAYLQELLEDFETNRDSLIGSIDVFEQLIHAMIGLLEQSALDSPEWTVAELNAGFRVIQEMPTFMPAERAYSNLTGSGDLKLLKSRRLQNALAQYFSTAELLRLVQATHELELVRTFQPYIIKNMDYQAVRYERLVDFLLPPAVEEDRILEVLGTREFRNIITQKWTISTDLLNQNRQMKDQTMAIISILEEEIAGATRAPVSQ